MKHPQPKETRAVEKFKERLQNNILSVFIVILLVDLLIILDGIFFIPDCFFIPDYLIPFLINLFFNLFLVLKVATPEK